MSEPEKPVFENLCWFWVLELWEMWRDMEREREGGQGGHFGGGGIVGERWGEGGAGEMWRWGGMGRNGEGREGEGK